MDDGFADVAIIGSGPAGLMAAEVCASEGMRVIVFEAMPSPARKFLRAGVGGLNLTHTDTGDTLLKRYGAAGEALRKAINQFDSVAVRHWADRLGADTYVGSSGRVFPRRMKAAPLLRSWLRRLGDLGVHIQVAHRWQGWRDDGALLVDTPHGVQSIEAGAVVLALGGASWPRLGSDARWVPLLSAAAIEMTPFQPANVGFDVAWSNYLRQHHQGTPVKTVALTCPDLPAKYVRGEFVVTEYGVEGSAIYALSAALRNLLQRNGHAILNIDLVPDRDPAALARQLATIPRSTSLPNRLKRIGISGVKLALLREGHAAEQLRTPEQVIAAVKHVTLRLTGTRPIAEAISSAGGVAASALTDTFMLRQRPGVFCAGEMLDWEAPTGGYLLTACLATGRAAGTGAVEWVRQQRAACAAR
ncbi:MAG: TIGR03862 family flavoprotein [Gammaproteobacteria bacterium]|nr:TIGR03862 family flavoprotein [Gammaproteobacteria bacterium]